MVETKRCRVEEMSARWGLWGCEDMAGIGVKPKSSLGDAGEGINGKMAGAGGRGKEGTARVGMNREFELVNIFFG